MRQLQFGGSRRCACGRGRAGLRAPAARQVPVHASATKQTFHGYSSMVDHALLLFIFQQDLGVQLQRALNMERFELAGKIREKRQEVQSLLLALAIEEAVGRHNAARGMAAGTRSPDVTSSSMDTLSQQVTLQSQLNEAIEGEDYAEAAKLRDQLDKIKAANEEHEEAQALQRNVQPRLRLGQRVTHRDCELTGVVVGWDRACCEKPPWREANSTAELSQGEEQPFYHVAVDARDWRENLELPSDLQGHAPVCYAAEEQLRCPEQDGSTWNEQHGDGDRADFVHPYEYILFLGKDARGDYIPSPELRNAYAAQRRDVYPVTESEEDEDPDGGAGKSDSDGGNGAGI